ncbi:gamma-glutamyltransferase family protein [Pseudarthrobacter sp. MDT3-26]|uniref:gamma-glutamyltransferase family protein n=1 Tax=Pseudarthrobacter raffinosi TaxID=2953651 RepID=UPI00208EA795|nr:gamma-glutamyltransferase family protein [Pseudarthrobacter sp. MDT3-26]MCO4262355.1 gamma-glutamyltransferase family protein [Pseudarthrobacter sp. MDT3-26]
MPSVRRQLAAVTAALALSVTGGAVTSPAFADPREIKKEAMATGYGGAVSTVDLEASAAAIEVLRDGGNAADAAVAAAATLGVTEPYSAGVGGGGYFVFYDAKTGKVGTIDGRETAPATMPTTAFVNPATGVVYTFAELVSSGVSVGVPGTPATWERALERWGTLDLDEALEPAIKVANRGFVVDETFRQQTLDNKVRFSAFPATASLFLPGGDAPAVGSVFHSKDLANTYRLLAKEGTDAFYGGQLAREIAATVKDPPKDPAWVPPVTVPPTSIPALPGYLTTADLAAYRTLDQEPTHVEYRGYDVYGMAPSSSGGTTVGETLNILEPFNLGEMPAGGALHHYLEATALAFADRAKYLGDPAFVDVPTEALTNPLFGKERACAIDPKRAATPKPVAAGDASGFDGVCPVTPAAAADEKDTENISTTNLTVADKWGNVVEYTLTIEQTGGSGIVVPGRGFLLNNELTDFSYTSTNPEDPNRIEPGKRPRSSMSPTIILKDEKPFLALGSPGGSTIITTVLQTILNRVDLGMSILDSLAAPRASQRNTANVTAEPEFIKQYGDALAPYKHKLVPAGDAFTSAAEIGAATAIEFGPGKSMTAVAEPLRRGGGSAMVVKPSR